MMRHLYNLFGDKHAQDKANWMYTQSDETYNYHNTNCATPDLKITKDAHESVGNITYINSLIDN